MYLVRWTYPSPPNGRPVGHDFLRCSGIASEETFTASWTTRDKATPLTANEVATVRGYWNEDSRRALEAIDLDAPEAETRAVALARIVTGEEAIASIGLSSLACAIVYVLPSSTGAPADLGTIATSTRMLSYEAEIDREEVLRELSTLAGLGLVSIDPPRRADERNGWQLTVQGDRLRLHFSPTLRKKHDEHQRLPPT